MASGFPPWALPLLRCPHCRTELQQIGDDVPGVVGCVAGHRFDVARQGYLPLLGPGGRSDTGDSAAMVAAREAFLDSGHYAPIAEAVRAALSGAPTGPLAEIGAGTGYYLAHAIGDGRRGLALDSSRYASRRAARRSGMAAVLADAWSALPAADGVAAGVLSVFAPRVPAELARITAPGGRIVVVTPEPEHLAELRPAVPLLAVDEGKAGRVAAAFAELPAPLATGPAGSAAVRYRIGLDRAAVSDLVGMGPTARHLDRGVIDRSTAGLPDPVAVTVSVAVTVLERAAPR